MKSLVGMLGSGFDAATQGRSASKLLKAGDHRGAAKAAAKAVAGYRELAQETPILLPELAKNLTNLATALYKSGKKSEAVGAAREAVEILHETERTRPGEYRRELALALSVSVMPRAATGDREGAIDALRGTVEARRLLAAEDPTEAPELARWLKNLSEALGKMGRRDEALAAAREASDVLTSQRRQ